MTRDDLDRAQRLLKEVDELRQFSCSAYTGISAFMQDVNAEIIAAMKAEGERKGAQIRSEKIAQLAQLGVHGVDL